MRIQNISVIGCSLLCLLASCDNEKIDTPIARVTVDKTQLEINESMTVLFEGVADQVVIYPGDDSHVYELREENNTGLVVNKGRFTYAYDTPGDYKAVCVATTYGEKGLSLQTDTCSFQVKVVSDDTRILRLSCPQVLYDEVYAENVEDNVWLMRLPRKVIYNGREISQTLSQKLKFYLGSSTSTVSINGNAFSESTKYNLASPLQIEVQSYSGPKADYVLRAINYPEFKSLKIGNVTAKITRDTYDYTKFSATVELPASTELTTLIPVFTLMSTTETAYIDGVEQVSDESIVDFSKPVVYRLVSVMEDGGYTAEAFVTVNVVLK